MTINTIDLSLLEVFFSRTQKLGIRILELKEIAEIISSTVANIFWFMDQLCFEVAARALY